MARVVGLTATWNFPVCIGSYVANRSGEEFQVVGTKGKLLRVRELAPAVPFTRPSRVIPSCPVHTKHPAEFNLTTTTTK